MEIIGNILAILLYITIVVIGIGILVFSVSTSLGIGLIAGAAIGFIKALVIYFGSFADNVGKNK